MKKMMGWMMALVLLLTAAACAEGMDGLKTEITAPTIRLTGPAEPLTLAVKPAAVDFGSVLSGVLSEKTVLTDEAKGLTAEVELTALPEQMPGGTLGKPDGLEKPRSRVFDMSMSTDIIHFAKQELIP